MRPSSSNFRRSAGATIASMAIAVGGASAALVALGSEAVPAAITGCGNNLTWTGASQPASTFGGSWSDSTTATVTMGTGGGNSGLVFSTDWSANPATDAAFVDGFNSGSAIAVYGSTTGNATSIAFNATVVNPVMMVNYIDTGAAMDFGATSITLLDSNASGSTATVTGNKVSLSGANNSSDGWAVQVNGTFGVGTPLTFSFINNNDTAGMTIVKSGGTGCTPASTSSSAPPGPDCTTNGYFQPVDMDGIVNTIKAGSTVPMKFRTACSTLTLGDLSAIKSFVVVRVPCADLSSLTDQIETTTSGATVLRWSATDQQYIQNWQTPTLRNVCYRVTTTMADDDTLVAYFRTK